ncbi:MAG: hypothetical protein IJ849_00045 [Selenomonadaceae bacterium]|nr:hypothetical protein [Selenomonadaceae bacterium]
MEEKAAAALKQIKDKNYLAAFEARGLDRDEVWCYGVAFCGKELQLASGQQ